MVGRGRENWRDVSVVKRTFILSLELPEKNPTLSWGDGSFGKAFASQV